jgi:hypothetical protein
VVAHEAQIGHKFCEVTGNVVPYGDAPSAESVLAAEGVGLRQFVLPLHQRGVDTAAELGGCTDAWLSAKVGLSLPAHLAKFRDAVADTTDALPNTASDGFKGAASDVAVHETKLQVLLARMLPHGDAPLASALRSAKLAAGGGSGGSEDTLFHVYEVRERWQELEERSRARARSLLDESAVAAAAADADADALVFLSV